MPGTSINDAPAGDRDAALRIAENLRESAEARAIPQSELVQRLDELIAALSEGQAEAMAADGSEASGDVTEIVNVAMGKLLLDVLPRLFRILGERGNPIVQEKLRMYRAYAQAHLDSESVRGALARLDSAEERDDFVPYRSVDQSSVPVTKRVPLTSARPTKVLIFSRSLGVLDALGAELADVLGAECKSTFAEWMGQPAEERARRGYLDIRGGDIKTRSDKVEIFKRDESPRVCLISLKAGATGLNLQSANVAFMCDPWWNPAIESQAIDRMYRLGSPHADCFIYRWVVSETLDERAASAKSQKQIMFDELFGPVEEASAARRVTREGARELHRQLDAVRIHQLRSGSAGGALTIKQLYTHQLDGIAWMREQETLRGGGLLADDMGVGKTVQTLCMVALDHGATAAAPATDDPRYKPTLIVCPLAPVSSWLSDLTTWAPHTLCHVYHADDLGKAQRRPGPHAHHAHELECTRGKVSADELREKAARAKAEGRPFVVLVNKDHFQPRNYTSSAGGVSALSQLAWRRVVIDESQAINNKANGFEALCALDSDFRWSLSGTAVENGVGDLAAHRQFLRLGGGVPLLEFALRRTKRAIALLPSTEADERLHLPRPWEKVVEVELSAADKAAYEDANPHPFAWHTGVARRAAPVAPPTPPPAVPRRDAGPTAEKPRRHSARANLGQAPPRYGYD